MPSMKTVNRKRKMDKIRNTVPKHILKSLADRLSKLSTDECITIEIQAEVRVSCIWDEGESPTLNFCEQTESPEDRLEDATNDELKQLGLSSIIELRDQIQKEITDWNNEVERLEKVYSIDEDLLADFLIEGHNRGN